MKCEYCIKEIPKEARGNRKYCSFSCYSSAKKIRDKASYDFISGRHKKYRRNLELLNFYIEIDELIPVTYLDKKGFAWDIYDAKKAVKNSDNVAYTVGEIAYKISHVENKPYVQIWKI